MGSGKAANSKVDNEVIGGEMKVPQGLTTVLLQRKEVREGVNEIDKKWRRKEEMMALGLRR